MKDIFIDFLLTNKVFDKYCKKLSDQPSTFQKDIDMFLNNTKPIYYITSAFAQHNSAELQYWRTLHNRWIKVLNKNKSKGDKMKNVLILLVGLCLLCSCDYSRPEHYIAQLKKQDTKIKTWEDGNVFYVFDSEISEIHRKKTQAIFNKIEQNTKCVYFIEVLPEESDGYIFIKYSYDDVSWGSLGYSKNSVVELSKQRFESHGWERMIYHEMFHCLGLIHEHQRPDRDAHVSINWGNIQENRTRFFKTRNDFLYDLKQHRYDVRSVMHYSSYAFSKNSAPTITFKSMGAVLGFSGVPSRQDYQKIISIYGG